MTLRVQRFSHRQFSVRRGPQNSDFWHRGSQSRDACPEEGLTIVAFSVGEKVAALSVEGTSES